MMSIAVCIGFVASSSKYMTANYLVSTSLFKNIFNYFILLTTILLKCRLVIFYSLYYASIIIIDQKISLDEDSEKYFRLHALK